MAGKGMRPKRGYNIKRWSENFGKINWGVKKSPKKCKCTTCKCKKALKDGEKPTTSPK
tara:strand:+ start:298 stop:471 length:174 start_codon:yes stop_codon:yes gene_type:complete